jgi:4-hydroxybenzoate polyprenyltransferase
MTSAAFDYVPLTLMLRSVIRTLRLSFLEGRPVVLGVFALRFTVGGVLTAGGTLMSYRALEGELSWFFVVWAVYLVNGITDLDGDRRNGSQRPLASGALSMQAAVRWCAALSLLALIIATLIGVDFVIVVVAKLMLGLAYSVGNKAAKNWAVPALLVAALGAFLTYASGAEVFAGSVSGVGLTFALVASSWIAIVGHSKDFGDTAGDLVMGRRTLPIIYGDRTARSVVAVGAIIVGLAGVFTASTLSSASLAPLFLLLPAAILVAMAAWGNKSNTREAQLRPYRAFMLGQYGLNILALLLEVFAW